MKRDTLPDVSSPHLSGPRSRGGRSPASAVPTALAFVSSMVLAGCGGAGLSPDADDNVAANKSELVVHQHAVWPTNRIPVCVVNRSAADAGVDAAAVSEVARQVVVREFEAKTVLSFDGWDTECTTTVGNPTPMIRMEFTTGTITCGTTDPKWIGCSMVGPTTSTLRNTHGATLIVKVPSTRPSQWTAAQTTSFQDTILHELLHGIGAGHEHARMDSTAAQDCRAQYSSNEQTYNNSDTVYIGSYDPNSVSNYCSPRNGVFTNTDVAGINALYSGRWVRVLSGVPTNAVPAGNIVGKPTYVCRAEANGGGQINSHPGKLYQNGSTWTCYIGNGGREEGYTTGYEVLVGAPDRRHFWRPMTSAQSLGSDVVLGGGVVDTGPAYVCRANQSGNLHAGN